jgi:hypothetical protein
VGRPRLRRHRQGPRRRLGPGQAVPLLARHIAPVPYASDADVSRLIARLDGDKAAERDASAKALAALHEHAEPALRAALAKAPSPEARRRLRQLLRLAERPITDLKRQRAVRAIEVLEHAGDAAAGAVLRRMTRGAAGARETAEALDSLARLRASQPKAKAEPSGGK